MPRSGKIAAAVEATGANVFSPVADRLHGHAGPIFPLHVGDTWMEPCVPARMESLRVADHPGMHRYGPTGGLPALREALLEKLRSANGLAVEPEGLLVTAGATSGLACLVSALADPGEEVLILAPFWPLIRGITRAQRAVPVEVPFYDRVGSAAEAVATVARAASERTVALYVSTPSNPTGRILSAAWLEALAALARENDWWLLSDEVYEDYVYAGEHVSIARYAPERTASVFSFSKSYGMAGNRVGYVCGPETLIAAATKVSVHSAYHAPTAAQLAALAALEHGAAWVAEARASHAAVGRTTAARLGLPEPEGSMFHFLDVASRLDARGMEGFLLDCLEQGVVVSPGASSGAAYQSWIRLCYSSAPPDQVEEAVRRLALVLAARATSDGST